MIPGTFLMHFPLSILFTLQSQLSNLNSSLSNLHSPLSNLNSVFG